MKLLLIITLSYLLINERKAEVLTKTVFNQHQENFREIRTILKEVNHKLQDIETLLRANEEVVITKQDLVVNRANSLFDTYSKRIKQYKLPENFKRANRKSSSPTVLSALEDSSTTSHPSYISKTTAKDSVSVLQRGNSQESKPSPELRLRTGQDYYRQLEDYNEGYLVVFMMELARLVAVKDLADVRSILRHTDSILFETLKSGKLGSLGYPVTHVLLKFGVFVSDEPIAVVRNYSVILYNMLRSRNTSLDSDVNSIIDYADMLYEDAERKLLFDALHDFEAYPNVTRTSAEVCHSLVDSFFAPYRRLLSSEKRHILLDAINYMLKIRFPKRNQRLKIL